MGLGRFFLRTWQGFKAQDVENSILTAVFPNKLSIILHRPGFVLAGV